MNFNENHMEIELESHTVTALTICNMNLVKRSVVEQYARDSVEYSIVHDICYHRQKKRLMAKETDDLAYVEVLKNVRKVVGLT